MRVIYLSAIQKRITIGQYCKAVKLAKANPDREFNVTLETWWPGTGKLIVKQFMKGVHDRINLKSKIQSDESIDKNKIA